MKTQISELINGTNSIHRDLPHPKYNGAAQATDHLGYAGTNNVIRKEIADKVISENPNGLDIEIFGKKMHLNRNASLSEKTVWYTTEISLDEFLLFTGYKENPFKNEFSFTLKINGDMTVLIDKFTRRNERASWQHRGYDYIDEAFITIL